MLIFTDEIDGDGDAKLAGDGDGDGEEEDLPSFQSIVDGVWDHVVLVFGFYYNFRFFLILF